MLGRHQRMSVSLYYFKAHTNNLISHKNSNSQIFHKNPRNQWGIMMTFITNNSIGSKWRKRLFKRSRRRKNWKKSKGLLLSQRSWSDHSLENRAKVDFTWALSGIWKLKTKKRSRLNHTKARRKKRASLVQMSQTIL